MGYTRTQREAIYAFRKKFRTNTATVVDEKVGKAKPLTKAQLKRLNDLSRELNKCCCRT